MNVSISTSEVTFTSKFRSMRYVVRANYYNIINGIRQNIRGKVAEFSNFFFTTSDNEVIDYLKNHFDFGSTLFIEKEIEKGLKDAPIEKVEKVESETANAVESETDNEVESLKFKCDKCDFSTDAKIGLISHLRKHKEV